MREAAATETIPDTVAAAQDLTIRYGTRAVLENFSLAVPPGCIGLLGPNGAGKSTLIKTLLGFLKPAAGTVRVLGHDVAAEPLRVRQLVGLMPEQECHIPGMNAVSFVAYAGELAGMPPAQALRRAHEVLEYCALGEARYRNVETYSTGMKQRIKLAQALVHGPRLLFLDEPTNGLDPQGRDEMLRLIREISRHKGISVLVSSHLLPDIERTCDGVIVMRQGRIITQGTIADLRRTETVQYDVELRLFSESFVAAIVQARGLLLSQQGSRLRFQFAADQADIPRLLFQSASRTGAQVRGFRPVQRSLQDIFLEAVGE